jgi:hypothetical protein
MNQISAQQQRARRLIEIAEMHASTANHAISDARIALKEHDEQKERLKNWKLIMSMEPVNMFTFFFIIVAVAEFIFSYEIYREMVSRAPWIMAIAFFGLGIILSEFIVYQFSKAKRKLLFYEKRLDHNYDNVIDDDLNALIKKKALTRFIIGIIGSIVLLYVIYNFSIDRANLEIESGDRTAEIGIRDWLPLILYAFEIIFGIYIFYFFKKIKISWKVSRLWNRFKNNIFTSNTETASAVKKYQEAEKEDYDPVGLTTSDEVHTAYFRKVNKSIDNKEDYITVPKKMEDYFNVKLVNKEGNPVAKHITIITKYKFVDSGTTNNDGVYAFRINTYPNDSVQFMFVKDSSNATEFIKIVENFDLDKNEVYTIIVG